MFDLGAGAASGVSWKDWAIPPNLSLSRSMIAADDSWYVRFPDGRVIRAANTTVVRQNIQQRNIPFGCMVRRAGDDPWRALERTREFADLIEAVNQNQEDAAHPDDPPRHKERQEPVAPFTSLASRLDPQRLRTADVRPVLQDVLAALDTALTRRKLIAAAVVTGLCGAILATAQLVAALVSGSAEYVWPITGLLVVLITSAGLGLLAKLTYIELQRMRPALWREGLTGLGALTVRLALAWAVVGVVVIGVPASFLWLSRWLSTLTASPWDVLGPGLAHVAAVVTVLSVTCLLPLAIAAFLFAPILVFDECPALSALRMWLGLLRQHRSRIILNEAAAVSVAMLLSLPFCLLVVAADLFRLEERLLLAGSCTRTVLLCLAMTLPVAFLAVANVFLFVNLRYDAPKRR